MSVNDSDIFKVGTLKCKNEMQLRLVCLAIFTYINEYITIMISINSLIYFLPVEF